uniref:DUF6291 domain-containing protein n=1 Tax=Dulem virus 33 TaxID=3145751 RepID=A0AAU8B6R1_9CAUD
MMEYKSGGSPHPEGNERFAWPSIRRDIDQAKTAYEKECERQRINGAKGGRPPKNKEPDGLHENPKNPMVFLETQESKIKTNQNKSKQNNSPNGERTRAARFAPPTLAEVQSYVAERHSPVDPQGFIDFYESKGWMVGKTPMKDWKAACRNAEKWERWSQRSPNAGNVRKDFQPTTQRIQRNSDWLDQFLAEQGGAK